MRASLVHFSGRHGSPNIEPTQPPTRSLFAVVHQREELRVQGLADIGRDGWGGQGRGGGGC